MIPAPAYAGGWLAGAALSQRPDLFCAAVLTVPSLDVVTTFQQDPCPGDSAELGDARGDEAVRRAVLAWSPADNVPDPQVRCVSSSIKPTHMGRAWG